MLMRYDPRILPGVALMLALLSVSPLLAGDPNIP
jgi:hypothetical protein